MRERVLAGMSGGVDSSVAALMLQRAGYCVVGLTAELFGATSAAGPCCGREGAAAAAAVCEVLGIPHHSADLTELFEQRVIDRFIAEYKSGRTPNPCSDCNRFIKFGAFFKLAQEYDCRLIATGHHARIAAREPDAAGAPLLKTGRDPRKDQSYFLACIDPAALARVRFPIGELTKDKVRELARDSSLPTAARCESQDICFLPKGTGIRELLAWHSGIEPQSGPIVDEDGKELGQHPGIEFFTIGQRQGLRLGGGSEGLVVHRLLPQTNTVVVAQHAAHPVASIRLESFNDMARGLWQSGEVIMARARYNQGLWPARVHVEPGRYVVVPEEEQYSLAEGQWLVGYRDDTVLFGGIMAEIRFS